MKTFKGKTAVITGAASGIGEALAYLAAAGFSAGVILTQSQRSWKRMT